MEILINIFSKIPQDKLLHYVCGLWIFIVSKLLLSLITSNSALLAIIPIIITIAISVLKEFVYDKKHKGTVSISDMIVTILGGLTGIL